MSDYIKRSDALNFDLEIECEPDDLQPMMEGMVRVMDYIKQLPTADVVEVKHGKWIDAIEHSGTGGTVFVGHRCSVCDYWKSMGIMHYCPNCGATMDGGAK